MGSVVRHTRAGEPVVEDREACRRVDLTGSPWKALLLWGPPIAVVLAADSFGRAGLAIGWPLGFGAMGALCVINAARCRRVHCYFTGPFFLLIAALSLLLGLRVLPWGDAAWNTLGMIALAGALVLWLVPEFFRGRYWAPRS